MRLQSEKIFSSFLMAGYECADHVNRSGTRVDLLSSTLHDQLVDTDYKLLADFNISTVREGIRWGFVEQRPYHYNWDEVKRRIEAGLNHNIQQIWEICHFGIPDDLLPTHPRFVDRFSTISYSFAELWTAMTGKQLILTPINEIGFLSWHAGDVRGTVPFAVNQSYDLKIHFLMAFIKAVTALKSDFDVLIMPTEPLIHIVPPKFSQSEEIRQQAAIHNNYQYQVLEILSGLERPDLGGKPEFIDLIGVNFYSTNQWEINTNIPLQWSSPRDEQWAPLHQLLKDVYTRYKKPLVLSETSHVGDHRTEWIRDVWQECQMAIQEGVDLRGICIYPAIDRTDWDEPYHIQQSGIWGTDDSGKRVVFPPYAEALSEISKPFEVTALKPEMILAEPFAANYSNPINN